VIALCSENFLASEWCLSEVAIAMDQGKDSIPLQIDSPLQNDPRDELPKLLQHIQAIDFRTNSEMGFQQLSHVNQAGCAWWVPRQVGQFSCPRPGLGGLGR
jgi:hypothetical protein